MSVSLGRALKILENLQGEARSLDELANLVDVHKTTVLRLLRTMEAERFVTHGPEHRYILGSRLFDLANAALAQRDIRTVARQHLEKLNADTGQTVHLAAYESAEVVYIDKVDAIGSVRMYSRIGRLAPLHCTAVAKILLSALPLDAQKQVASEIDYVPYTTHTITNADSYLAELEKVKDQGFAEDREEHESFINCVAVAVRNGVGATVSALSISAPNVALSHPEVMALLPRLRVAADAISAGLGWTSEPDGHE